MIVEMSLVIVEEEETIAIKESTKKGSLFYFDKKVQEFLNLPLMLRLFLLKSNIGR